MSLNPRITASLLLIALGACGKETPKTPAADTAAAVAEVKGTCAEVYQGQVCTWAKTQGTNVMEVGLTVPMASIENAPAKVPMVWPPVAAASLDVPGSSALTRFTMFWEADGHPPGPYLTPHFDFHFNTISDGDLNAIDCSDLAKPTDIPASYALPDIPLPPDMAKMMGVKTLVGLCVPKMGMHSLLQSEMESKEAFHGTMVVGYYHGKPIFVEPMLTKAMLMEKKSFDLAMPTVPGLTGLRPSKFHAEFDAAKQEYRMTFSGFTTGG